MSLPRRWVILPVIAVSGPLSLGVETALRLALFTPDMRYLRSLTGPTLTPIAWGLAGLTALQALRDEGAVKGGSRVLVHGASGGVGVHAIQIARELGAHVTTTSSARNREHCRQLGSHETFDYAADDGLAIAGRYDCVFDVFGNLGFSKVRRALAEGGTYVTTVPGAGVVGDRLASWVSTKRARLVIVRPNQADLELLARYIEKHRLRPIVDRMFPLGEAAAAQRYIETKRARGKVVLRVA